MSSIPRSLNFAARSRSTRSVGCSRFKCSRKTGFISIVRLASTETPEQRGRRRFPGACAELDDAGRAFGDGCGHVPGEGSRGRRKRRRLAGLACSLFQEERVQSLSASFAERRRWPRRPSSRLPRHVAQVHKPAAAIQRYAPAAASADRKHCRAVEQRRAMAPIDRTRLPGPRCRYAVRRSPVSASRTGSASPSTVSPA